MGLVWSDFPVTYGEVDDSTELSEGFQKSSEKLDNPSIQTVSDALLGKIPISAF